MSTRKPPAAPRASANETRALRAEYPACSIIEFRDRDEQQRTGLVIKAERGELVVRSPAAAARKAQKTWGVTTPTPHLHRVPRARIVRTLHLYRPRQPVEEE